jgi:hypothetical protein
LRAYFDIRSKRSFAFAIRRCARPKASSFCDAYGRCHAFTDANRWRPFGMTSVVQRRPLNGHRAYHRQPPNLMGSPSKRMRCVTGSPLWEKLMTISEVPSGSTVQESETLPLGSPPRDHDHVPDTRQLGFR